MWNPFLLFLAWSLLGLSAPEIDQSSAIFIGSKACGSCHEGNHRLWSDSLHSRMIQPASADAILGDFETNNTLEYQNWRFKMFRAEGRYWIHEWSPSSDETVYRIDYTLGSKRIQHYLATLPDGRIRVTSPTWNVRDKRWFHSQEIIPNGDVPAVSIQIWNQHCYNCHVSQEVQGFDINADRYQTRFTEPAINCEMCHGPGSVHAALMKADKSNPERAIVHPGKLPPDRQMLVCVQCHTPRVIVQNGFHPGKNYYDYYMPSQMHFYIERSYDPPIWADGRMRRFATEGAALWQSACYREGGATCISCHNPHLNTVKKDKRFERGDVLCVQCHERFSSDSVIAAHTHHPLGSEGSRCVSCHMPPITNMMTDRERDHTISIPVPEVTGQYDIPNACNVCHDQKSVAWSSQWMDQWYPERQKINLLRAEAFTLARNRDPKAVPRLIDLVNNRAENRVIRASAAGFLGEYRSEEVEGALIQALADPDVMVRAEAARSLSEVSSPRAIEPLKPLLEDPNRIVRLNAVFALMKLGVLELNDANAKAFARADAEFFQFLNDFPDIYDIRVNLGTYHALHSRYLLALQEYKNAVKLQPDKPLARYYLGVTYAQLGLYEDALKYFAEVLEIAPGFRNTEELKLKIEEARGRIKSGESRR